MTRDEFIEKWMAACVYVPKTLAFADIMNSMLDHDVEQRAVINTLNDLVKAKESRCDRYQVEITKLREALEAVLLDLQIVLPMAKGYAHEHPVGSNKDKVYGIEAVIERAQQALKEVKP